MFCLIKNKIECWFSHTGLFRFCGYFAAQRQPAELVETQTKRCTVSKQQEKRTVILISRKQSFAEFNFRSNKDKLREFYLNIAVTTIERKKNTHTTDDGDDAKTNNKRRYKIQTEIEKEGIKTHKLSIKIVAWTASSGPKKLTTILK